MAKVIKYFKVVKVTKFIKVLLTQYLVRTLIDLELSCNDYGNFESETQTFSTVMQLDSNGLKFKNIKI